LKWPKHYEPKILKGDLYAGVLVAVMLVPQSMAYAMLAGLPPVVGLYASTFPLLAYAVLGSSRQLAVGPVAMISLLLSSICSRIASPGTQDYLAAIVTLTLLAAIVQLVLGLIKAGFLVNFVSHAVVSGFTSAAAILIALSQLKHLAGIPLTSSHSSVSLFIESIQKIREIHSPTLALGGISVLVLVLFKRTWPAFPAALLVVIAGTLAVFLLRLDRSGVTVMGLVPAGLPRISVPLFRLPLLVSLFPQALVLVFVGFMESMAVAQWVASREKYRLDANREFLALGVANLVSALSSGFFVTGGFSRTAVNYQAGAKTRVASIISALLVFMTLLFLTPMFHYLPNAVLAAVIIVAVIGLIDLREAIHLFKINRSDGWILVVTFMVTLVVGIDPGLLTGILFSLVLFVYRSSHPRTVVLGYVGSEGAFRDIQRYPEAVTHPKLILIRVDASLYFANARFVEDRIRERWVIQQTARWVVMDMSGVNDIDAVAVSTMDELMEDLDHHGVQFAFAGMKRQVRRVVERAGWHERLGKAMEYPTLYAAFQDLEKKKDRCQQQE